MAAKKPSKPARVPHKTPGSVAVQTRLTKEEYARFAHWCVDARLRGVPSMSESLRWMVLHVLDHEIRP